MSKYFILHNLSESYGQTLRDSTDQACRHLYHDKSRVFSTNIKCLFLTVSASALIAVTSGDDPETFKTALTTVFSLSTAYMAATVYECRKKISDLKDRFDNASVGTSKAEKHVAHFLPAVFDQARPSIPEMIDIKKYPVRTVIAIGAPIGSMSAVDGNGLALSIGAYAFSIAAMIGEEDNMDTLYKEVAKSRERIDKRRSLFFSQLSEDGPK